MRARRTLVAGLGVALLLAVAVPAAGAAQSGSAPGVTGDTIKVAYPNIDWSKLKSSGVGASSDRGDDDKIVPALVDDINARGGVNGRKLEAIVVKYDVLNPASAESACVSMTEDSKVFAVIHPFQGPVMSVNACITDHDTVMVGGEPDPAVASQTAWISHGASPQRVAALLVDLLDQKGVLKGKTVGVSTDPAQEQVTRTVLLPALKKSGHAAKVVVVNDAPAGDVTAADANYQVFAEKFKSAEVDHIVLMGQEAGAGISRLLDNGVDAEISSPNTSIMAGLGRAQSQRDPADYDGAYTVTPTTPSEAFKTPTVQRCVKAFKTANPNITVKDPADVPAGEPDWGYGIAEACNHLDLFVQVATKAGRNLTNQSFREAAQSMTANFATGSNPYNTFGPDKFDANNGFRLAVFDHTIGEIGGLKPLGKVVNLGPTSAATSAG